MVDPRGSRSSGGSSKWIVLVLLGLVVYGAFKTGWLGFGLALVKSKVLPRDEALLEWVPPETGTIVIVDPHQFALRGLGSAQSAVRARLERMRNDIKKATDVDLSFDVDKVVLTHSLVVMRGRFNGEKLSDKLADYKYARADYHGQGYLLRTGEDALLAFGDFLLYGDESAIKAAIDAKAGTSLAKSEKVTERLAQIGWDHPLIVTVQLNDDRPSLRSMLTGATGSRAVTFGVRSVQGLEVRGAIEAEAPSAAEELARVLDEKRKNAAELLTAQTGPELASLLGDVAKNATIRADSTAGVVKVEVHISQDTLAVLLSAAEKSEPLLERYRAVRLLQLLLPGR